MKRQWFIYRFKEYGKSKNNFTMQKLSDAYASKFSAEMALENFAEKGDYRVVEVYSRQ